MFLCDIWGVTLGFTEVSMHGHSPLFLRAHQLGSMESAQSFCFQVAPESVAFSPSFHATPRGSAHPYLLLFPAAVFRDGEEKSEQLLWSWFNAWTLGGTCTGPAGELMARAGLIQELSGIADHSKRLQPHPFRCMPHMQWALLTCMLHTADMGPHPYHPDGSFHNSWQEVIGLILTI